MAVVRDPLIDLRLVNERGAVRLGLQHDRQLLTPRMAQHRKRPVIRVAGLRKLAGGRAARGIGRCRTAFGPAALSGTVQRPASAGRRLTPTPRCGLGNGTDDRFDYLLAEVEVVGDHPSRVAGPEAMQHINDSRAARRGRWLTERNARICDHFRQLEHREPKTSRVAVSGVRDLLEPIKERAGSGSTVANSSLTCRSSIRREANG